MTLKLTIEREVNPKEIVDLIDGTGALSYPWWVNVRFLDTGDAAADTRIEFTVDHPNEPEGSGITLKVTKTIAEIVDAAAEAIKLGHVADKDAIREDLGYCDSEEADCVLQIAVFGTIVYG